MEVQLTPDQEAQLNELAGQTGRSAEQVVLDAIDRLVHDKKFRDAVIEGLESLDRGEYVESVEVWNRVERVLDS